MMVSALEQVGVRTVHERPDSSYIYLHVLTSRFYVQFCLRITVNLLS